MLGKIIGTAKKVATTAVKATPAYQVGSAVKKSGWGTKLLLASPAGLALTALVGDKKPMAAAQGEYPPMRPGMSGGFVPNNGATGGLLGGSVGGMVGGSIGGVGGGPLPVGPPAEGTVVGGGVGIGPGGAVGPGSAIGGGVGPRAGGGGAVHFQ